MTIPVQLTVVERNRRTCERCAAPLRLKASIDAGRCCCCRSRCGLDVDLGCQVCGQVLIGRHDEVLGVCVRCSVVLA